MLPSTGRLCGKQKYISIFLGDNDHEVKCRINSTNGSMRVDWRQRMYNIIGIMS